MENQNMEVEQTQETVTEQEEKTFTQEEVDGIVQARLERERKRLNAMINEDETIKQELLESRLKLEEAKELREKDYPQELLEVIDFKDAETCKESTAKMMSVFDKALQAKVMQQYKIFGGTPASSSSRIHPNTDPVKNAFQSR